MIATHRCQRYGGFPARSLAGAAACLMLAGCVTTTTGSGSSSIDEAATGPLRDVGIVRRAPDPVLAAVADAPYALTEPVDCAG